MFDDKVNLSVLDIYYTFKGKQKHNFLNFEYLADAATADRILKKYLCDYESAIRSVTVPLYDLDVVLYYSSLDDFWAENKKLKRICEGIDILF